MNAETFEIPPEDVGIHVDAEGDWYYGNRLIFRKEILQTFYEHLGRGDDGGYFLEWQGKLHPIRVDDTPFVITRVDMVNDDAGTQRIRLTLKHLDEPEWLDPETVWVGRDNVLYCRVRDGAFPARFSRPAYYQIAQWIEPDEAGEGFSLRVGDRTYPVPMKGPA
ncbi:hypothetical protein SAMN02745206_01424 [Desulfacinum infernum DSM 9756]|uniref:DUF1285 domain-containing protein n=1 Tax=Desulfacinum infernum DSM 9756 TaxID=1121391 RepID=A0A1M4ZCX2_9BACT|nr:DUF1285 domain-containing protein [Desulfacinum infernum]MBC7358405.1 DUF1285 domain-containing protein [Desulfacinum sp.]SHF15861.1 hypothetical protein SAMN02745206_01424 [Desulfacinum infernum DSM 9756]